jgi:hypothetical protein
MSFLDILGRSHRDKNDLPDRCPVEVTVNLFSALCDSRDETWPLRLWANALCINQQDNEEKFMQIPLMGSIYTSALRTIIYLGPSDSDAAESCCLSMVLEEPMKDDTKTQNSVDWILGREWFTRVWVFQELVFSRDPWIQCGRTRVTWNIFYGTLIKILERGTERATESDKYQVLLKMQQARARYRNRTRKSNREEDEIEDDSALLSYLSTETSDNRMLDLLRARRGLGVTDPRDMIYAHVGFASDSQEHESMIVNYSKASAQVYEDFAQYVAEKHGIHTLLYNVSDGRSPSRRTGLPSWVPDWTEPQLSTTFQGLRGRSFSRKVTYCQ